MALILAIETSTKVCSIAIHEDGAEVAHQAYHLQKSHSSLLPAIVNQLMENAGLELKKMDAIAVSSGPGSYTGLRIGCSTAKGLCYGLNIPLIAYDSLDSIYEWVPQVVKEEYLICPMLDARRMEVYCNLRGRDGGYIWSTRPLVLTEGTFASFRDDKILLVGNGAEKCRELYFQSANIYFEPGATPSAHAVGRLIQDKLEAGQFEDLAYFEPDYLKEFQTKPPKQKLKT